MDVKGLDVVLTSLAQDSQELDAEAATGVDAARATEARLSDLAARVEALRETVPVVPLCSLDSAELTQRDAPPKPVVLYRDWEDIRRAAEARLVERGVDLSQVSLDALLDPGRSQRMERQFQGGFSLDTHLDGYDVAAAAVAGLVAGLADFLIVRIPKDILYLGEYTQKGSPLTKWLHSLQVPSDNWLARWFKVSYDKVAGVSGQIPGMGGRSHRLHTLGHDPLVGLVVGTIDIMRGGLTAISKEGQVVILSGTGVAHLNPFTALVWQIMHLLSDGFTRMGLPPPGWSLLQLFRIGSFGEKQRTVADLARYMYLHGYDSRHFLTMSTSVAAAEVVLRGYFWVRRRLDQEYDRDVARAGTVADADKTGGHPRFRAMALAAHATAAAINAGKVAIYHGNPLAINYAQWLRFFHAAFQWVEVKLRLPSDVLTGHARANLMALDEGWAGLDLADPSFPRLVVQ